VEEIPNEHADQKEIGQDKEPLDTCK